MTNIKRYRLLDFLIYFVLLFIAYILQTSNILFEYNSPSPSLILAIVLTVSFFENYWFSAVFGLAGGILIDTASADGSGYHALIYMLVGLICSLIVESVFQNNFASFAVVSVPVILINMFIDIILKIGFTDGIFSLFFKFYLLVAIYTFAAAFILYLIFRFTIKKDDRFKKPKGIISNNK